MASRLLLLLLGARQAAAAPTCLRDVANSSSRVPCRCADSSVERWAFVSCNWPVLDGGFKEQGWNGLVLAGANNSACVEAVLTSSSGPNCTTAAVEQAVALVSTYTAIYSAGFELGDGIKAAALSHPEINFATADVAFSSDLRNLQGILFAEEQAAFLAGYLAGLVTSTGVVGAVLGPEIAPVIRFANGFTNGALEACALLGKSCISIRKYIPSFGDGERGWRVAELLSLRGADVIFEAGGYTGTCGVAGASSLAHVRAVVGVDVDRYLQPNACALGVVNISKVITSAVKRIDQAIIQVAQSQLDNVFTAGDKIFAADRDGIGISPCHDACSIALDCGSVSCSVASTGVGTTVASAREHILSTIFPAFASGDSILANTRVNAADGSVVGALGVGLALSGHTSVTIELFNPFGGEAGGRPKVIIFGGQTTGGYSNELLVFIPDDSTYSFLDGANGTYGAPAPRADHSTILDGNNVMWVFFGRTASGVAGDVWSIDLSASQNVWVEHVRTGSAGVGIEREGHSSCLFNDGRQALIFGGVAASGSMLNDLWIFDLQTHSWAEVVATYRPAARRKHTATVIGEKMYIFGGTNAQRDELVDLWAYASGEGGQSGTSLLDDLHVYSPSANSWTKRLSFGAHVHKHSAHSAAEIGGRIYMISGIVQTTTGSAERTADIYVHNADEPLEPPSLVSATTNTITLGWYASNSYTQGGSDSCSCFASIVSEYQLQLVSRGGYTTLYYGDLTSFTVQGLESGSAYEFRIRGGGVLGFTGWSAGITHNTTRLSKVAQPVTEVRVGILLPLFGLDGGSQSWSPRVGVYQAIREINNKSDGVADHLIPKTQLLIAFRESKCDATTSLTTSLQLTRESFGGEGVNVIIATGMVDVLLNLFKYSSVALVSSSDAYGVGGASAFSDVAVAANLTLAASVTFLKEAVEFKTQHRILLSSSASVIVLFAQGQEGYRFVRSALTVGIGGDGYLWMVGDPTLADESFWAGEIDTRQEALKGLFSFDASKGQGSVRYEAYRERRRQLPPMSNGTWCNLEKDDDGNYLWGQEIFQNSSTPLLCAGDDPDREAQFDPFGYDAVFAVVHALHELIEVQNRSSIVGSDLLNVLLTQVRFEGITGLIDFHAASDDPSLWRQGDRLTGFKYTLHNYVDNVQGLLPVGSWSPAISGVYCPSNTTIETLFLNPGYWRHSSSTLETWWIQVLEFDFSLNAIIPDSCFGSYHRRLLIGSLWPICLIFLAGVASAVQQLAAVAKKEAIHLRHVADKVEVGLQRVLPLALVATFVLHIALVMIVIWPLGVPFLYAVLLWSSRDAVRIGKHTRLSRATAFLAGDYKHSVIWWEPVEMCRKLTLTGWVLLIPSDTELARVLVALLVSIAFLALQLSLKPFKRPEDGTLMMVVQLVLVLVYTCVALIKTCNLSADVCVKYGFGGTASGIYQFFILFGLTMLIFQIFSAVVKLWIEGRLPKILLVARAHSVPLSTIVSRVLLRRGKTLRRLLVTKLKLDMPRVTCRCWKFG
ncbi:hypothetical protein AB1Y20_023526 [Prymnesium parvum]|uniref:Fibronectin type-III domain-containing protein n=1 Tax=Prymnesium parvum TaxID=97485 RepID=A0AB34JDL2_PRYPA